jgi:phosphinothricin acetyltransferase
VNQRSGGVWRIRPAESKDAEKIAEIYNDAVLHSTATFDTEPKDAAERREWLAAHGSRHPVLVAEDESGILGWASLSAWSQRCAYEETVEFSVYLAPDARGKGLGFELSAAVLEAGRLAGAHTVLSRVVGESEASLKLHERLGFERVGVMKEVGFKFGRRLDVVLLQKINRTGNEADAG